MTECRHDECLWRSDKGELMRFKTKGSRNALANHHAVENYHPCCTGEGNKCKTGKRIRSWRLLSSNVASKRFVCKHESCGKMFSSQQSRSNHHKQSHSCLGDCTMCKKPRPPYSNIDLPAPEEVSLPVPEEVSNPDPEKVTVEISESTQRTKQLIEIAQQLQNPSPQVRFNDQNCSGSIVTSMENGLVSISTFNLQFEASTSRWLKHLADCNINISIKTYQWITQQRDILDQLFLAKDFDSAQKILLGDTKFARELKEKQHNDSSL